MCKIFLYIATLPLNRIYVARSLIQKITARPVLHVTEARHPEWVTHIPPIDIHVHVTRTHSSSLLETSSPAPAVSFKPCAATDCEISNNFWPLRAYFLLFLGLPSLSSPWIAARSDTAPSVPTKLPTCVFCCSLLFRYWASTLRCVVASSLISQAMHMADFF